METCLEHVQIVKATENKERMEVNQLQRRMLWDKQAYYSDSKGWGRISFSLQEAKIEELDWVYSGHYLHIYRPVRCFTCSQPLITKVFMLCLPILHCSRGRWRDQAEMWGRALMVAKPITVFRLGVSVDTCGWWQIDPLWFGDDPRHTSDPLKHWWTHHLENT